MLSDKNEDVVAGKVPAAMPNRKIVRFKDLATCGGEVWIEYEGKIYRLQSTKQGKLVLTK